MSKLHELQADLNERLAGINIQQLSEQVKYTRYLHDRVVPMINEVVMAASDKKNYEDAYKSVIDKLRAVHEKVAKEKQEAESMLMSSLGKQQLLSDILPVIAEAEEEYNQLREKLNKKKVEKIAEKIQSGTFDPDAPRKIGTRPESIKNIRTAKATLFGEPEPKDQEG